MTKRLILFLALAYTLPAATLMRIACAGSGGVDKQGYQWAADTGYYGGLVYVNAALQSSQDHPFKLLRYAPTFYYQLALPNGNYKVTLKFLEPTRTGPGLRLFDISINGVLVEHNYDVFAEAGGLLKPYDESFPITISNSQGLKIVFTATLPGINAVVSGIQIDDVAPPIPVSALAICEVALGDGGRNGTLFPSVFALMACENMDGRPRNITRVRCRSDVDGGAVLDVMARDTAGVMKSLLVTPIPCTSKPIDVAAAPGASYLDGEILYFMVRVNDVTAAVTTLSSQVVASALVAVATTPTPKPIASLGLLEACTGSSAVPPAPGWDCKGLYRATIARADGTVLPLLGAPPAVFPVPVPNPAAIWSQIQ